MKNKKFNCVEMMHQGAEKIRKQTKGMTRAQELAYWKAQAQKLRELQSAEKAVNRN
jgi:hypothetical protein